MLLFVEKREKKQTKEIKDEASPAMTLNPFSALPFCLGLMLCKQQQKL
jgi:hypothetical protein